MAISGLAIAVGATSVGAVTGGTSVTFSDDKSPTSEGIHTIDGSDVNFFTRKSITYRSRQPKLLANGTYQKGKRVAQLSIPFTKADNSVVQNIIRVELEVDPELNDAGITSLLICASQLATLAGTASFWKTGSLA